MLNRTGHATLQRENTTQFPATDDAVQYRIINVQSPPFADGQIVKERNNRAITDIKRRKTPFTFNTIAVLWVESVKTLGANTAGIIDRFGPGIRANDANTLAEAARRFNTQRIVIGIAAVLH